MQIPAMDEIRRAQTLVRNVMPVTPTYSWPLLNARAGAEVWLKHENHSPVGAFKLRTATVYLDWLRREHPEIRGVVAATARNLGWGATIVVPFGNSKEKNRAMRALGAELVEWGEDFQAANEYATELAGARGLHKVPSFAPLLAAGTAAYALEMLEAAPELERVYVPVGMGSSICGFVAAREALGLKTKIVGVTARAAPATALSFAAGRVVPHAVAPTLADGLACRLPDEAALGVMLKYVERIVEVDEEEMAAAMRAIFEDTHNVAEGAGAAAVAAVLKERDAVSGKRVGAVISGGNVDREVFAKVLGEA